MKSLFIIPLLLLIFSSVTFAGDYQYKKHHCGCKSYYTKKYIVGYDSCRRPIYRYYYAPVRHTCRTHRPHHHNHNHHYYTPHYRTTYYSPYRGYRHGWSCSSDSGFRLYFSSGNFCR